MIKAHSSTYQYGVSDLYLTRLNTPQTLIQCARGFMLDQRHIVLTTINPTWGQRLVSSVVNPLTAGAEYIRVFIFY